MLTQLSSTYLNQCSSCEGRQGSAVSFFHVEVGHNWGLQWAHGCYHPSLCSLVSCFILKNVALLCCILLFNSSFQCFSIHFLTCLCPSSLFLFHVPSLVCLYIAFVLPHVFISLLYVPCAIIPRSCSVPCDVLFYGQHFLCKLLLACVSVCASWSVFPHVLPVFSTSFFPSVSSSVSLCLPCGMCLVLVSGFLCWFVLCFCPSDLFWLSYSSGFCISALWY